MKLTTYKQKRNFEKTSEPKGKVLSSKTKNLYSIQKHSATHLHYDLRLELNGVLLSWAIPKGPSLDPSVKRLAIQTEDHPVEYGTFEGIIPMGEYGGGTVMLWDTGTWTCDEKNPAEAYDKGHIRFTLKGRKLKGHWDLIKIKSEEGKAWFLIKSRDNYAKSMTDFDVTVKSNKSALSKQTIEQIAKKFKSVWTGDEVKSAKQVKVLNVDKAGFSQAVKKTKIPAKISPQLATLVDKPPSGDNWLHEIKLDGYRMLAFIDGTSVQLMSRNHLDWTDKFKNIAKALAKFGLSKTVLDGEVVLLDENHRSDFQLLQNAVHEPGSHSFIFYIFDLLYYDGNNITNLPLIERKTFLHQFITSTTAPILRYSDHIIGSGDKLFEKACQLGLEGIISKDASGKYYQKRTKSWLKIKCSQRQEFLIGGYTQPHNQREYFGSLLLGYYNNKKEFIYCGHVGTGFNSQSLKQIYQSLQKQLVAKNPFTTKPPGHSQVTWVKPTIIAEVEFSEWTRDGSLRHPSFKGLRNDKPPAAIKKEKAVKLTHPDKIVYPEDQLTKQDIANYYQAIHQWIMPYIKNRPLSLLRCPSNYKNCFYQKHLTTQSKNLHSIEEWIYLNNKDGLFELVQMGVLEIHPWGSTIKKLENPDMMIFDLDPGPNVTWKKVVTAALRIREHLQEINLQSFVKSTGGKGLHVVVPIKAQHDWQTIKTFAHTFVDYFVQLYPKEYVSQMTKSKREGKIYLDYLRNQRGATAVAAYSTRAREHATVSTPLAWDELTNNINDTLYTIQTLPERLQQLKSDPWAEFLTIKQTLRLEK